MYDKTMNFLYKKKFLYKFKSGFRKVHSADPFLSYHHGKFTKGFGFGHLTGMILFDLPKTFDTNSSSRMDLIMRLLGGIHHIAQIESLL